MIYIFWSLCICTDCTLNSILPVIWRIVLTLYICLHCLILGHLGGVLSRLNPNGIMLYHTPLQTHQKELFENGEETEACKCGCFPPLNEWNTPKRGRIHYFHNYLVWNISLRLLVIYLLHQCFHYNYCDYYNWVRCFSKA